MTWTSYRVPMDELPHVRETRRLWQRKERHRKRLSRLAHGAVYRAIKTGKLVRSLICEECDKQCKTLGHHKDYNYPLKVVWLCHNCHRMAHFL